MFDGVSAHYDLINSVMTAGLHHRWREKAADRARLTGGEDVLDVACGTGDLTLALQRRVGRRGQVVGSDFSEPMLVLAREKSRATAHASSGSPRFEWADALALPYDERTFDVVTVGFGFRNFADFDLGIAEMARVLKPGGRLVILEMTAPVRPPLSTFFSVWFDRVVPILGRAGGSSAAYRYLPASVREFPAPERLAARMDAAALTDIRWTLLGGGIIAVHVGVKRAPAT